MTDKEQKTLYDISARNRQENRHKRYQEDIPKDGLPQFLPPLFYWAVMAMKILKSHNVTLDLPPAIRKGSNKLMEGEVNWHVLQTW